MDVNGRHTSMFLSSGSLSQLYNTFVIFFLNCRVPHRAMFRVKCFLWLSMGCRMWITGENDQKNSLAGRWVVVFIKGCKPIYGALVLDFGANIGIGILLCSGHSTARDWDTQDLGFGQIVIKWPVEWFSYQRYCNVCYIQVVDYIGNLSLSCGTLTGNELKSPF